MWIACPCGNRIHDNTDFISYKARIIADQDFDDMVEEINKAVQRKVSGEELEDVIDAIDDIIWRYADKDMYQCPECKRIFIDGVPSRPREVHRFVPEGEVPGDLLISVEGSKWRGFLEAEWKDEKTEWMETHGSIYAKVNPSEYYGFDDQQAFIKRYYELFEELKKAKRIRSAILWINGKRIHDWG